MKRYLVMLGCVVALSAGAQQLHSSDNVAISGFAGDGGGLSAEYFRNWTLGKHDKIVVGLGARYTGFFGKQLFFVTAPAKLTSGKTGPAVLFTENITENIDSLLVQRAQTNALNLALALGYQVTDRWYAGFSIDLIGYTFGKQVNDALYIRDNNSSGSSQPNVSAKPTPFNVLLVSDNDRGTLNSNLFVRYRWNSRCAAQAGAAFVFSEYTSTTAVQQFPSPNDRFRYKSLTGMLGITWFIKKG